MNDRVSIPRVGELKTRVYPARADLSDREIHPPHSTIHFEAAEGGDDDLLVRFVAHNTGMSEDLAAEHLERFSEEIISGLQSEGRAAIDHLGVFYRRGDEILYAPDNKIANLRYAGLETVSLPGRHAPAPQVEAVEARSAIAAAVTVEHEDQSNEEPANPAPEGVSGGDRTFDKRILWLAGLFALIFLTVIVLAVVNYNMSEKSPYPSTAFNRAPMPEPIVSPTSDDTMPDTNSAERLPGEDTMTATPPAGTNTKLRDKVVSKTPDEVNSTELPSGPGGSEPDTEAGSTPSDTDNEVAREEESGSAPEEVNAPAQVVRTRQCHVVVGAFGVSANVQRMVTRLESLGYAVDTMPSGDLTQVGVPAPCNSAEIERVLEELRSSVESQAWILNK